MLTSLEEDALSFSSSSIRFGFWADAPVKHGGSWCIAGGSLKKKKHLKTLLSFTELKTPWCQPSEIA